MPLSRSARAVRRAAALVLAATLAGCHDQLPTESTGAALPGRSTDDAPVEAVVVGRDLGVLPGETTSEATLITDAGVVYGRSGSRFFRWTEATGMRPVASIPAGPAEPPIPAGAPAGAADANVFGEVTGAPRTYRWSASEGVRYLDLDFTTPVALEGRSINRWGHVLSTESMDGDRSAYWLWTTITNQVRVPGPPTSSVVRPLGDDDVVYTHERLTDRAWRPRAASPHIVGGSVVLAPPNSAPGGNEQLFTCYEYTPPLNDVVLSANSHFEAVGVSEMPCIRYVMLHPTTKEPGYRRAVLWDLRPLERARPLVLPVHRASGRWGVPTAMSFGFDARGSTGPWTVMVDWGDKSAATDPGAPGTALSMAHTFLQPGVYRVRVYARDALGAWNVDDGIFDATRPNAAPTVAVREVGARAIVGRDVVVRGRFVDDSPADGPWTFEMDWGAATRAVASGLQPHGSTRGKRWKGDPIDFHYTFDVPGTYTFRFTVTDAWGATQTAVATVEVAAR